MMSVCELQLNVRSTGQQLLLHVVKHQVCWLHVSLRSAGELYWCFHLQHYVLHVVNDAHLETSPAGQLRTHKYTGHHFATRDMQLGAGFDTCKGSHRDSHAYSIGQKQIRECSFARRHIKPLRRLWTTTSRSHHATKHMPG